MNRTMREWEATIRQLKDAGETFENENYHAHPDLYYNVAEELERMVYGTIGVNEVNIDLTKMFLDFLVNGPL